MAQTCCKCFRDRIKAVTRDTCLQQTLFTELETYHEVRVVSFSLASEIPSSFALTPPSCTTLCRVLCSRQARVTWHAGSSDRLLPDPGCPMPSVGHGGLRVLKVFQE